MNSAVSPAPLHAPCISVFKEQYSRMFDELPSETIKKTQEKMKPAQQNA